MLSSSAKYRGQLDEWVYLGQGPPRRQRAAAHLGSDGRIWIAERLREAAERNREPFIKWVAEIGRGQQDPMKWWATRFASRSPFLSNAFLLTCFAIIFADLVETYRGDPRRLLVVVEDPWLFSALRTNFASRQGLFFGRTSRKGALLRAAKGLLRGTAARGRLALRVLMQSWRFRRQLRVRHAGAHEPLANERCWIYSRAEPGFFRGSNEVYDAFMPGLQDLLERNGVAVQRVLYPVALPGELIDPALSRLDSLWPLSASVRWQDIVSAMMSRPSIAGPFPKGPGGLDLSGLVAREVFFETQSSSFMTNVLIYKAFVRFFGQHSGATLFFFYEGQPWEKLLCLARRFSGSPMRLVGYQHAALPRLDLSYFPHRTEWDTLPHPDSVVVNGSLHRTILEEAGYPPSMISNGGAWRYRRSSSPSGVGPAQLRDATIVFVALPIDAYIVQELMELVITNTDVWIRHGIKFLIKSHPHIPLDRVMPISSDSPVIQVTASHLRDLAKDVDAVLYSSTSLGLESALMGIPTIAFFPEGRICPDAATDWLQDSVYSCTSSDFCDALLNLLNRKQVSPPLTDWESIWGPIVEPVWIELATSRT